MRGEFLKGTKNFNDWVASNESDIIHAIDNICVRRLVDCSNFPLPLYSYSEEIFADLIEKSIERLNEFNCVGIFENRRSISEYLIGLFKSPIVFDEIINPSIYDMAHEEISCATQLNLQEYTFLDWKIYNYFYEKDKTGSVV